MLKLDGPPTGLTGKMTIPANGQTAVFMKEISGLESIKSGFRGILRLSSAAAISVVGSGGRYNERNDFLITTTMPSDEMSVPSSPPLFLPHVVDSRDYSTQFVVLGSGMLQLFSYSGGPPSYALQNESTVRTLPVAQIDELER